VAQQHLAVQRVGLICILTEIIDTSNTGVLLMRLTDRFLAGGEPDDMGGVGGVWSAAEDREDSPQALCAWLSHPEDIQVSNTRRTKVGGTVDIQIEVEGSA
jgi:hypothetical protein